MTAATDLEPRPHPAKFSPEIVRQLRRLVLDEHAGVQARTGDARPLKLLDPFAGSGGVHELEERGVVWTMGVELEEEWASQHPRTQVGDATDLPADWTGAFDVLATSVCYGNRLADGYDGAGECKRCEGSGDDPEDEGADCTRCKGAGHDTSKRFTYRIALGRPPSPGSACPLRWGAEYRDLHVRAMVEWERVLRPRTLEDPGGLLLLNTSNFMRLDELQLVTEWFVSTLASRGWRLLGCFPVGTRRIGFGSNRDLRDDFEMVTAARPPAGAPTLPLAP